MSIPPPPPPPPPPGSGSLGKPLLLSAVVAVIVAVTVVLGVELWGTSSDRPSHETAVAAGASSVAPTTSVAEDVDDGTGCPTSYSDETGDFDRLYTDRGDYPVADAISIHLTCANDEITFSVFFAEGTDMVNAGIAGQSDRGVLRVVSIDTQPGADSAWRAECPEQDGEDFSLAVNAFEGANRFALLSFESCDAPYPSVYTGSASRSGTAIRATLPYSEFGVRSGEDIMVHGRTHMLLDGGSVLDPGQDYFPDSGPITVRLP